MKQSKTTKKVVFPYVKITDLLSFLTRFPKSGPTYRGQCIHDTTATIICKARNGAETSRELCICRTRITYVKESLSVDQKVINDHKNPSDNHNYHNQNHDEIEFYLGNSDRSTWWHSTLEHRTPKNQSDWLYGYGVRLTNVQCHRYLYPYHDIENTGTYNWKHTWNHTVSNHPIHQHGHTNFWYVCLLERVYFNSKNAAIICGMYIINGVHGPEPRVVRRKHIIQPTGFGVYSSTCF